MHAILYVNDFQNKTAYISLIAVRKDSQKTGIGASLITWCEKIARNRGMKLLRLEVNKTNAVARAFYEKQDFYYEPEQKKTVFI